MGSIVVGFKVLGGLGFGGDCRLISSQSVVCVGVDVLHGAYIHSKTRLDEISIYLCRDT